MNDFKHFHEEVMDLLLLSSIDDHYGAGIKDSIEIQRQQEELMKRMTSPTPKSPEFNGDILAYPKWF